MKTFAIIVSVLAFTSCAADENIIAAIAAHGGPFPGIDGGVRDSGNGGASGEAGSGGSAGSGCAAIFPLTLPPAPHIMPLGDSVTHGNGYDIGGGYRQYLWTALPAVIPIGTSTLNPLPNLVGYDHQEGHPGATLPQLAAGIAGWLATTGPADAILLHGGTNDTGDDVANAAAVVTIYQAMIAANPRAILFVASPIIPNRNPTLVPLHDSLVAAVAAVLPTLPRAIAVPMPELDPAVDFADDFHPDASGYLRMANAWKAALAAIGVR
jgi:hypothetical protein